MLRIILFIFIIFYSCNNKNNIDENNTIIVADTTATNLPFYEIDNDVLVKEIEIFLDTATIPLSNVKEKILNILVKHRNDTTIYMFSYCNSAFAIVNTPFTFFSKVKGNVVVFSYLYDSEIKLSDSIKWEYLKETFLEQYNKYYKDGILIPPNLNHNSYVLKFKDKKLIDKYFLDWFNELDTNKLIWSW